MKRRTRIIYIGNLLQGRGLNPTTIDTLGDKLEADVDLVRASKYSNPVLRLLHMWFIILAKADKNSLLLIDTYSSSAFHFAWTSAWISRRLGMKYIPYLHGGSLPRRYDKSPSISRKYFEEAHKIVSPSNYLKEATEKKFERKVKVIPNFIELENYTYKTKEHLKTIKLLWVRSFARIYNPELALQVVSALAKIDVKVHLEMVGPDKDGSGEACRQKAREMGIDHLIKFRGRLSKFDWIKLSQECNIFINTTNADNTPVSVMEAMALGMPVVTTNVGGIPFLFKNRVEGIMVEPENVEAMVHEIMNIKSDPIFSKKLSVNARRMAENWDWNVVKRQWMQLFEDE